MRDITENSNMIAGGPKPLSPRRWRRKLIGLLVLLGILGGAGIGGLQMFQWSRGFQCADKAVEAKKPDTALNCLDSLKPRLSQIMMFFGRDARQLYLALFNELLAHGENTKALHAAEAGHRKFPWEPAFLGNRALALFHLGRHDEAVSALQDLFNHPQYATLEKTNGVRLYQNIAQIYLGARKISEAETWLQKGLALEPENPLTHLLYARLEALREKFEAMAGHYEKTLAASPQSIVWQDLFLLALHHVNAGRHERFQEIFAQARRDFPHASGFHLLLASKFLKEGNYTSAYYEVLLEKEMGLADAAFFSEALNEIEKQYRQAFQNPPAETWLQPLYFFIQGREALEKKETAKAESFFNLSLQSTATHPLQYLYLGRAAASLGKLDEAIGYYGITVEKQPALALASAELAGLYIQKGKLEPARSLWQKALAADPHVAMLSNVGGQLAMRSVTEGIPQAVKIPALTDADKLMKVELNRILTAQFLRLLQPATAPSSLK